ncbi:MAG: hypothetical protein V9F00_14650 [Nocardioides sp.]
MTTGQVDVGLEQRDAGSRGTVASMSASDSQALAAEGLEGGGKPVGQGGEHVAPQLLA